MDIKTFQRLTVKSALNSMERRKKKTQPSNLGEKCQILIYSSQNNTI